MNSELTRMSDLKPVSFDADTSQSTYSLKLTIKLIKEKLKKNEPVTIDDIRDIHAEYAMKARRHRVGLIYVREKDSWRYPKTKDEWLTHHCTAYKSKQWFKFQLGSAILKGKLVVLPVIDI